MSVTADTAEVMEMSSSSAQLPVMPSIRPKAVPSALISSARAPCVTMLARNAVSLYSRYCTAMFRNGVRQMASTASIPKIPTAFFSTPAPASTVPVASEMMDPTTGTAVAMALRVICTVMASAAPVAAPVRVRKPVNTTMVAVRAQVTALLIPAPIFFRP